LVWFNQIIETDQINQTDQNNQPVFALRDNTERPETITIGTNELLGTDPSKLPPKLARLMAGEWKKGVIPPKWDGKAAERIVECLSECWRDNEEEPSTQKTECAIGNKPGMMKKEEGNVRLQDLTLIG
jgi:UDP-N-acetylglucosamine 2-epimerase (non-hydrolysing)